MEKYRNPEDGRIYDCPAEIKNLETGEIMVTLERHELQPGDKYFEIVVSKSYFDRFEPIVEFDEMPEDADLYSKEDFLLSGFINSDGFGILATATKESNIRISPSKRKEIFDKHPWATHVVWYNK